MQLTARPHRSNDSSGTDEIGPEHFGTLKLPASGRFDPGKSLFRRQLHKRSSTDPNIVLRRIKFQFGRLSIRSKLLVIIVFLLTTQSVLVGLFDRLFYSVGVTDGAIATPSSETHFAVVINTYKRPDMLREAVQHYADLCGKSSGVSQVFIVWAEPTSAIPESSSFFDSQVRGKMLENRADVIVLKKEKDSLNSRFEPISQLDSTAVFMVDDDLRVTCTSLSKAFQAWKANPDTMAGFYPRLASPPRGQSAESSSQTLIYHTWPIVWWKQSFNFVLTKASFLHAKYLKVYSDDALFPRAIKDYVDQHMNCEDIAMSMLVANYTRYIHGTVAHPIYVEGDVSDKGLMGGISTGTGHMATRSDCLTQLTAIGKQHGWQSPFSYEVPVHSNSWIHHAPGFWWQYHPSNSFEWFALANTFT